MQNNFIKSSGIFMGLLLVLSGSLSANPLPNSDDNLELSKKLSQKQDAKPSPSIAAPNHDSEALKIELRRISDSRALLSEQIAELELKKKVAALHSEINTIQAGKSIQNTAGLTSPSSPLPTSMLPTSGQNLPIVSNARSAATSGDRLPVIIEVSGFNGLNSAVALMPNGEKRNLVIGSKLGAWVVVEITNDGALLKNGKRSQLLRVL
jgi:type IV pilus biogenesis protein PilP